MTTTDRELLEAAAKAAGIKVAWRDAVGCLCYSGSPYHVAWNPLTDDGEALRLAVKLRIRHERHPQPFVAAWAPDVVGRFEEPEGSDPYAATRRAIVRAAASLVAVAAA